MSFNIDDFCAQCPGYTDGPCSGDNRDDDDVECTSLRAVIALRQQLADEQQAHETTREALGRAVALLRGVQASPVNDGIGYCYVATEVQDAVNIFLAAPLAPISAEREARERVIQAARDVDAVLSERVTILPFFAAIPLAELRKAVHALDAVRGEGQS